MANKKRKRAAAPHGKYANYFKIGHNAAEFVIDLGQFYPNNGDARFHTRIITGPRYARALLETLATSLHGWEAQHGEISETSQRH